MSCPSRDVFLCHTSADKKQFVEPFIAEIKKRGITYWYEEAEVKWGDIISRKISDGLRISRFVVVFLSENFIGQNWPEAELSSALSKENEKGETVVLPIVIGDRGVMEKYQLLKGKRYLDWNSGVSAIADELASLLRPDSNVENVSRKPQGRTTPKDIPDSKQLLNELFKLGSLLADLQNSTERLAFAAQMVNSLSRIVMRKYGIPTHDDATDVVIFIRELELGGQTIAVLRRDLYSNGISLEKFRSTVKNIQCLLDERPVYPHLSEDVWRDLTNLYGEIMQLLMPTKASDVSLVMQLISHGESHIVEFKSSLKWDMKGQRINKDLPKAAAKEVAAFMNSEGGTLLIGVDDDGDIIGLEKDFDIVPGHNPDGVARIFHETVSNLCGKECYEYVHANFVDIYDKTILCVMIDRSSKPIYYVDGDNVQLYVRIGNITRPLNVREAIDYYQLHWQNLGKLA